MTTIWDRASCEVGKIDPDYDLLEDALQAGQEAAETLAALLPFVEHLEDEGPRGEGWQSEALQAAIARAKAAIAPLEGVGES